MEKIEKVLPKSYARRLAEKVLPKSYARRLVEAVTNNKLSMVVIVSHEAMSNLKQGEPALLEMADDVIVLLPQALVEEIYSVAE